MAGGSGFVAAVDLGATSGRVMLGRAGPGELALDPVARFANDPVRLWEGTREALHWDLPGLFGAVRRGLAAAARQAPIASIGIDSWAVDYGLIRNGALLGLPYHYRDERTTAGVAATHQRVPFEELYRRTGLQFLPLTTLYQLRDDQDAGRLELADRLLLIPDLLAYWLTGRMVAETTNASTTGLFGVGGQWDLELVDRLGLPARVLAPLVRAGETIGPVLPEVAEDLALAPDLPVTAVGSHDTASAVVAVPMSGDGNAYISCGTWGLVGVELEHPVLSEEGRRANFTNEGGVDGRVRYLHNVMGLWLLSESVRTWERSGERIDLRDLLRAASAAPAPAALFDVNDPAFLATGDMPSRIVEWFDQRNLPAPDGRVLVTRCIVESLAQAFADAAQKAASLSGRELRRIHLVGGGALNGLLCQAVADRAGLPVIAGPVEATALGNVLVQARSQGFVTGDLDGLRALVARSFPPRSFTPRTRNRA